MSDTPLAEPCHRPLDYVIGIAPVVGWPDRATCLRFTLLARTGLDQQTAEARSSSASQSDYRSRDDQASRRKRSIPWRTLRPRIEYRKIKRPFPPALGAHPGAVPPGHPPAGASQQPARASPAPLAVPQCPARARSGRLASREAARPAEEKASEEKSYAMAGQQSGTWGT